MAILRGCRLRPVEAARPRSQQRAALGGKVSDVALANNSASRIVKRYAWRVGLDPASYAGHSPRSGVLTSAAESAASI